MCRKQVFRLILFLLYGGFCIIIGSYVSIVIFFIILCSVIIQGIMTILSKKRIFIKVLNQAYGECGEETGYNLVIDNKSIFPIFKGEVLLQMNNTFMSINKYKRFTFSMAAKTTYTISGKFLAKYCGNIRYSVKEFRCMDYLGIFRTYIRNITNHEVTIIPQLQEVSANVKSQVALSEEWKEIRKYRYGDDIRNIHWKISAKFDETMIRERIAPKQCCLLIIYENGILSEYEAPHKQDKNRSFEFFFSFCYQLLDQGYEIKLSWLGEDEKIRFSETITNQELLFSVLVAILRTKETKTQESMLAKVKNHFIQENIKQIYVTPYESTTSEEVTVYNREEIRNQLLNTDRMEENITKKDSLSEGGKEG